MTSKRRENINLVSFICLSFLVISFSKQLLIKYLIVILSEIYNGPILSVATECVASLGAKHGFTSHNNIHHN